MSNLLPAQNIQAAAVAGVIMTTLQHALSTYGYSLSPDVANGLTALVTVLVAHAWDVLTGQGTPPTPPVTAAQETAPARTETKV